MGMGLTLMADDVQRLIGRLEAGVEAIIDRVNRSDEQTARKFQQLEETQERNKQAAIQARMEKEARDDEKHLETAGKLDTMDRKLTTTFGLSSANEKWISESGKPTAAWVDDHGRPLVNRVVALETIHADAVKRQDAQRNRKMGAAAVWATLGAGVAGLGTMIGLIGLDGIAALLARAARAMGAN